MRSSGVDGIEGKVEMEEEDLYVVESGGEKGGGITAVPFVPRSGGETEKNEISRITRQWNETRRSASERERGIVYVRMSLTHDEDIVLAVLKSKLVVGLIWILDI